MDTPGIEPGTFRMQSGRATTALCAQLTRQVQTHFHTHQRRASNTRPPTHPTTHHAKHTHTIAFNMHCTQQKQRKTTACSSGTHNISKPRHDLLATFLRFRQSLCCQSAAASRHVGSRHIARVQTLHFDSVPCCAAYCRVCILCFVISLL